MHIPGNITLLQWKGLQHTLSTSVLSVWFLQGRCRIVASHSRSGQRHIWQQRWWGATLRFPNWTSAWGSKIQGLCSSPWVSMAARRASSSLSFIRFIRDCATDFSSSSSTVSCELSVSFLRALCFQRRFTKLLRFERNIKHWCSSSWTSSSNPVVPSSTELHSTMKVGRLGAPARNQSTRNHYEESRTSSSVNRLHFTCEDR